jgi:Asp-tRNA(Asn)/Glu-tRNA(Gln) amidotransferase A subunit family amidase
MDRRAFLALGALAACKVDTPIEIEELTLADLSAGLKSDRWTSHKLVELYLARIDAMNHKGPNLGAVIELNPDALEIPARLDKSTPLGPLHGIPILLTALAATGKDYTTIDPNAVAGYPHITVPAVLFRGLPIGLSFFSTKARRKPTYAVI